MRDFLLFNLSQSHFVLSRIGGAWDRRIERIDSLITLVYSSDMHISAVANQDSRSDRMTFALSPGRVRKYRRIEDCWTIK